MPRQFWPFFVTFDIVFMFHVHNDTRECMKKAHFHVATSDPMIFIALVCDEKHPNSNNKGDKAAKEEKIVSAKLDFGATRQEREKI